MNVDHQFVMTYKTEVLRRRAEYLSWSHAWEQALLMNDGPEGLTQADVDDWVHEEGWIMRHDLGGWYRFLPETLPQ